MNLFKGLALFAVETIAEPFLTKVGEVVGELVAGKVNPNYSGLVREDGAEEEQEEDSGTNRGPAGRK